MSESIDRQRVTLAELKSGIRLRDGRMAVLIIGAKEAGAGGDEAPVPGTVGGLADGAFAIEVQLTAAGGTPLAAEPVRIVDPDSGQDVGKPGVTDERGVLRARVPEQKEYEFHAVAFGVEHDDPWGAAAPIAAAGQEHSVLFVALTDRAGSPLANENVTVKDEAGSEHPGQTDGEGCLRLVTDPGVYELRVRENTFVAHTLFTSDLGDEPKPYRFSLS
jgi:hypothetical protein